MKTGLIAYRQALRKVSFNHLKCCTLTVARQWLKLRVQNFHTLYNNSLPLKPSFNQVDKKQVSPPI